MMRRRLHNDSAPEQAKPDGAASEKLTQWSQWAIPTSSPATDDSPLAPEFRDKPADATVFVCQNCGYDLREQSAQDRCPECGTSVQWSIQRRTRRRDESPNTLVWIILTSAGAGALSLVLLFGAAFTGSLDVVSFAAMFVCCGLILAFGCGGLYGKFLSVESNLIGATIFSWPTMALGLVFLLNVLDEPGVGVWFAMGCCEFLACMVGGLVGRRFK